jgi:hypothetical protein
MQARQACSLSREDDDDDDDDGERSTIDVGDVDAEQGAGEQEERVHAKNARFLFKHA